MFGFNLENNHKKHFRLFGLHGQLLIFYVGNNSGGGTKEWRGVTSEGTNECYK